MEFQSRYCYKPECGQYRRSHRVFRRSGSDGKQEIQNSQKNWNENTDKIFGNQNNKPTNDGLSDVKTQLEFIKDDLNEINSVNTQTIDKKGGKK